VDNYTLKEKEILYLLPIGDIHLGSEECNLEYLSYWKETTKRIKNPKRIYLMGDLVEAATKKLANSSYRVTMTLDDQIQETIDFFKPFKDDIVFSATGNHECFDDETEILTREGWVKYDQIDLETEVGTYNIEKDIIEFQNPEKVHIYPFSGELNHIHGRSIDLMITDNHRLYLAKNSWKDRWVMEPFSKLKIGRNRVIFRCCGNSVTNVPWVSDDEIRLAGWAVTDSYYGDTSTVFYQRKSNAHKIRDLLNRLKIPFRELERDRNITHICGKKLKKRPEIGIEFHVKEDRRIRNLVNDKKTIPKWVYELSDEQFKVFLDTVVEGDGSKHKNQPLTSWMVYKNKEFLDQLQIACLLHGHRTSITEYRSTHFRLNIKVGYNFGMINKLEDHIDKVPYTGIVWCVTTPNDTVIVRRNSKPIVTGNSRLSKDYDLDITRIIANGLGCEYGNQHIDYFSVNENPLSVYLSHGKGSSMHHYTAESKIIRDTNSITTDMYFNGHNHRCGHFSIPIRTHEGLKRKHYVFTGAFLGYGGYADSMQLPVLPEAFCQLRVNKDSNVRSEIFYIDQRCPEIMGGI
jgi:hypothetical protein